MNQDKTNDSEPRKVLIVCPPGHYVLRNFSSLPSSCRVVVSQQLEEIHTQATDASVMLYSGLTGKTAPIADLFPLLTRLEWIHSLSAGVERVLTPELRDSSVILTNARGVFKRPLAEFAVLAALYFYKRVRRLIDSQRARRWDDFSVNMLVDRTAVIVGYGEIGRECALLLKAMGMRIHALRRRPERSAQDSLVERSFAPSQLHQVLPNADLVVAAAPLTPETHHLLNDQALAAMRSDAILVNVGRGPVVDEQALIRALEKGTIAGAALDVFEHEPLAPDSPLWAMENVLISPHCTDRTSDPDWLDLSAQLFVRNLERFQRGEELENIVDKHAGY